MMLNPSPKDVAGLGTRSKVAGDAAVTLFDYQQILESLLEL